MTRTAKLACLALIFCCINGSLRARSALHSQQRHQRFKKLRKQDKERVNQTLSTIVAKATTQQTPAMERVADPAVVVEEAVAAVSATVPATPLAGPLTTAAEQSRAASVSASIAEETLYLALGEDTTNGLLQAIETGQQPEAEAVAAMLPPQSSRWSRTKKLAIATGIIALAFTVYAVNTATSPENADTSWIAAIRRAAVGLRAGLWGFFSSPVEYIQQWWQQAPPTLSGSGTGTHAGAAPSSAPSASAVPSVSPTASPAATASPSQEPITASPPPTATLQPTAQPQEPTAPVLTTSNTPDQENTSPWGYGPALVDQTAEHFTPSPSPTPPAPLAKRPKVFSKPIDQRPQAPNPPQPTASLNKRLRGSRGPIDQHQQPTATSQPTAQLQEPAAPAPTTSPPQEDLSAFAGMYEPAVLQQARDIAASTPSGITARKLLENIQQEAEHNMQLYQRTHPKESAATLQRLRDSTLARAIGRLDKIWQEATKQPKKQ